MVFSSWGDSIVDTKSLGTHHIGHKHTKVHTSFLLCDGPTLPQPPPHSLTQFASGHWTGVYEVESHMGFESTFSASAVFFHTQGI